MQDIPFGGLIGSVYVRESSEDTNLPTTASYSGMFNVSKILQISRPNCLPGGSSQLLIHQACNKSQMQTTKMPCPACFARAIILMAWSGRRPPLHGQPNIMTKYRCEQGHSFQTVRIFNGTQYHEYYAPS